MSENDGTKKPSAASGKQPTSPKSRARRALRFTELRLENWKNFLEVHAYLQGRVFLMGPNASGKSNLLDVFRFLNDLVSVGGGFQEAVTKRGGVSSIRCLAARRRPNVAVGVNVNGHGGVEWRYELHFAQDNRRVPIVQKEFISRNGEELLLRPDEQDRRDPEQLRQTHLEQVRVNEEFRELATFFQTISYRHIVPQLVRDPDRYRGRQNDPFGWDLLERVTNTPKRTREAWLRRMDGKSIRAVAQELGISKSAVQRIIAICRS